LKVYGGRVGWRKYGGSIYPDLALPVRKEMKVGAYLLGMPADNDRERGVRGWRANFHMPSTIMNTK